MIDLLPDQVSLINAAKEKIRGGCRSLLIQGATGSGKTYIASEIVSGAFNKGKICNFIVPRRDLLRQTSNTFKEFRIPHSFIAAGMNTYHRNKIFICSTQTLKNRLSDSPDIVVIDEGHVGGNTLDRIIKYYKSKGAIIILLSATPWKLSGKGLGCWVDDMVCGPSIRWLIDNKRLSDYRPFAPSTPDLSQLDITGGDYAKGQLAEKMENDRVLIGNAVKHYIDHANGKLNVAYCVSVAHSEITAQAFRDAGISAMHMDGKTPDDERVKIIKSFANREIKVITNCELLTYGFDLASNSGIDVTIECMSDLRPTKSLALQMQKWGRVLRKKDFPALIFDHANNFQEHGMPCDDREWSLEDRIKINRESGEREVQVRQCPKCFYCHKPAPICPNCSHLYEIQSREIKEIDGELKELEIIQQKKHDRMKQGRAKTMSDLWAIAKEKGYKPGWVWKQAQLKGIKG